MNEIRVRQGIMNTQKKVKENNMGKVVGVLVTEDLETIRNLFEKKLALENLTKIIDVENQEMYDKLVMDYGKTMRLFQEWWITNSQKYGWEGKNWSIDFETSEIISNDI